MREAIFSIARYDARDRSVHPSGDLYVRVGERDRVTIATSKDDDRVTRLAIIYDGIDHREFFSVMGTAAEVAEKLGLRMARAAEDDSGGGET